MTNINVAYLELDHQYNVLKHNAQFRQLFATNETRKVTLSVLSDSLFLELDKLVPNQTKVVLLLKNKPQTNSLMFLYVLVTKTEFKYIIRIANWLNWIHQLHASMAQSYSFVSNLSNIMTRDDFVHIADAGCFKAFYPLITHVPDKYVHGVNQVVLFEIMNVFVKQRGENCTKDYSRNLFSRLRTSLRKDHNLENTEILDVIRDDGVFSIKDGENMCIPKTQLLKDIIINIEPDQLLNNFMHKTTISTTNGNLDS